MNEVIMTEGTHIEYSYTSKSITFGDEDLTVNLKNREKDEKVTIDICTDRDGELVMGTAAGLRYVAQVEIPAREYTKSEIPNPDYDPEKGDTPDNPENITVREAVPFDIEKCTIYLWALGNNVNAA